MNRARSFPLSLIAFALACLSPAQAALAADSRAREVSSNRGDAGLTTNIFAELSDEVTQKMLQSDSFKRILEEQPRPRLVVGKVQNRTDDETIDTVYIGRKVSEVVIESGLVRWFEFGANDFDLVASPSITGIYIGEGRRRELRITLTLTLSDVFGEVKGRWSAEKTYVK